MSSRHHQQQPHRGNSQPDLGSGNAEFEMLAKQLANDGNTFDLSVVVLGGVLVALIVLSLLYSWPSWIIAILFVIAVALIVVKLRRRSPVAPVELTASERQRVQRTLQEHGIRPAITLVKAMYPTESHAAAVLTVRNLLQRSQA